MARKNRRNVAPSDDDSSTSSIPCDNNNNTSSSENEEEEEDPFAFQSHSFQNRKSKKRQQQQQQKTTKGISQSSTASMSSDSDSSSSSSSLYSDGGKKRGRKKKNGEMSVEARLKFMEEQSKKKRVDIYNYNDSSSSDDDDDDDVMEISPSSKPKNSVTSNILIALDDSSDEEEEMIVPKKRSMSPRRRTRTATRAAAAAGLEEVNEEVAETLREAREAREALKRAQMYHAEDIVVDDEEENDDEDDLMIMDYEPAVGVKAQVEQLNTSSTGALLKLTLRTNVVVGSLNGSSIENSVFKIRSGEKLQSLMDNYRNANTTTLPPSTDIQFSFDGQTLNLNQTPTSYDMEDEDLLDVIVKITSSSLSLHPTKTTKPTQNLHHPTIDGWRERHSENNRVIIITRLKHSPKNIHKYQLKKNDPFQKLVDVYRKQHVHISSLMTLEYNGREIDLNSTPSEEGMVDNTTLDVVDEGSMTGGLNGVGRGVVSGGNSITIKMRVNGKDDGIQSFTMEHTQFFSKIIKEFCDVNGVDDSDCKFRFDGDVLSPMGTPEQEDLEGDEIVDVVVDPSILGTKKKKATVTPKPSRSSTTTRRSSSSTLSNDSTTKTTPRPSRSSRTRSTSSSTSRHSSVSTSSSVISIASSNTTSSTRSTRSTSRSTTPRAMTRSSSRSTTTGSASRSTPSRGGGVSKKAIKIQTIRNNKNTARPKQFRLYNTDTIGKLKKGYMEHYKSEGCRNVKFYFNNSLINYDNATLESLGVGEMDVLYAMENGRRYQPV